MVVHIERSLSFDTIVAPYSENSILNKSIASLVILFFFVTVTTGYPILNKWIHNTVDKIKTFSYYY